MDTSSFPHQVAVQNLPQMPPWVLQPRSILCNVFLLVWSLHLLFLCSFSILDSTSLGIKTFIIGLTIFPLEDHLGYGTWSIESSHNHYIHHSKFNWNYSSSPLWDHLMGTNWTGQSRKHNGTMSDREKEAIEQAKLANCKLEKMGINRLEVFVVIVVFLKPWMNLQNIVVV